VSSAKSETTFSHAGRVKNSTRASISANSVEAQVVLRSNEDFWREFEIDFRNSNKMELD
jgi:hypothetical protein